MVPGSGSSVPAVVPGVVTSTTGGTGSVAFQTDGTTTAITITPATTTGQSTIRAGTSIIVSQTPVQVDNGKLFAGGSEVKVSPDSAVSASIRSAPSSVLSGITLQTENGKPTYVVKYSRNGKLLGILSISYAGEAHVNAETGQVSDSTIPWWWNPLTTN